MQNLLFSSRKIFPNAFGTVSLRALLDSGPQTSFLIEDACQKLNLAKQRHNLAVSGLGGKTSVCTGTLNLTIWTSSSITINVKVFVLPKLTQNIPSQKVDLDLFEEHQNISYADPVFQARSNRHDFGRRCL